jgi:hypothetical protein
MLKKAFFKKKEKKRRKYRGSIRKIPPVLKPLGSITAITVAAAAEEEEEEQETEDSTEEGPPVSAHATAITTAVYNRLLLLLLLLLGLELLLLLRMGIEMKKTKTRRPSWRRAMLVQRRCAKQLIPLSGSKPATRVFFPHVLISFSDDDLIGEEKAALLRGRWV